MLGSGKPDRAELMLALERVHDADGGGLGHAVELDELVLADGGLKLLLGLHREGGRRRYALLEVAVVQGLEPRVCHEHVVEGGDVGDEKRLVLGQHVADVIGVAGVGQHDLRPAVVEGYLVECHAGDVEHREGRKRLLLDLVPLHVLGRDEDLGDVVAVGEDRPLGNARGAAGIHDEGGIVRADLHAGVAVGKRALLEDVGHLVYHFAFKRRNRPHRDLLELLGEELLDLGQEIHDAAGDDDLELRELGRDVDDPIGEERVQRHQAPWPRNRAAGAPSRRRRAAGRRR